MIAPAPVQITRAQPEEAFALTSTAVIRVAFAGRAVTVRSIPRDGSPATVLVRTRTAGDSEDDRAAFLAASDEVAAVAVNDFEGDRARLFVIRGGRVARRTLPRHWYVLDGLDVDAGNVLVPSVRLLRSVRLRTTVIDGAGHEHRVPLPGPAFAQGLAGEYVGFLRGRAIGVAEWRTARVVRRHVIPEPYAMDVRADGAVAATANHRLVRWLPGQAPERLGPAAFETTPSWAGDRIVLNGDHFVRVVEADGTRRLLGVRTGLLGHVTTSGDDVLWYAHGCLLTTPVTASVAGAPAPGPCPRTEVRIAGKGFFRGHHVRVGVRCVAAPPPGCRVQVDVQRRRSRHVVVRAGSNRYISVPMRRAPGRFSVIPATVFATDPDGRVSRTGDGIIVARRRAPTRGLRAP